MNKPSKHRKAYYAHVMGEEEQTGAIGKAYDIIDDLSDRKGIGNEWEGIQGDIQDEIVEKWIKIIERE